MIYKEVVYHLRRKTTKHELWVQFRLAQLNLSNTQMSGYSSPHL